MAAKRRSGAIALARAIDAIASLLHPASLPLRVAGRLEGVTNVTPFIEFRLSLVQRHAPMALSLPCLWDRWGSREKPYD